MLEKDQKRFAICTKDLEIFADKDKIRRDRKDLIPIFKQLIYCLC